jgi:hypothetical protein
MTRGRFGRNVGREQRWVLRDPALAIARANAQVHI